MVTARRRASVGKWAVYSGKGMQVAESLMKYNKDDLLIGDEGVVVATADSEYPLWAFNDQIFLATLEDAQRTAAALN